MSKRITRNQNIVFIISYIIVTKNIDELQGETKDWGTCGRKVAENLVKVTKASEDVEQNVKDMNLNVQEQVKTLSVIT